MFEVEEWLHSRIGLNFRSGLGRMQKAVDLLENPEQTYPIIHVTGTNGKGSTIAFMRELFVAHGKRVGTFTSPHIVSIHDRICINGNPISDADFIRLANEIKKMEKRLLETHDQLSFFELLTLIALLYFKEQDVDLVLLEVGIGGLLDTTNVVTGEIAVITSVGLDHQETLGNSLEEIAEQKSGIFKSGKKAVIAKLAPEAQLVCQKTAKNLSVDLYQAGQDFSFKKGHFSSELAEERPFAGLRRSLSRRKCGSSFTGIFAIYGGKRGTGSGNSCTACVRAYSLGRSLRASNQSCVSRWRSQSSCSRKAG